VMQRMLYYDKSVFAQAKLPLWLKTYRLPKGWLVWIPYWSFGSEYRRCTSFVEDTQNKI
jgi:hypothetical protein